MPIVGVVLKTNAGQETTYRAVSGGKQASGRTVGEAIDALTPQLDDDGNAATLIVVQSLRPDRFFDASQQQRLTELMTAFRAHRDASTAMPGADRAELEQLVDAETRAAGMRAAALLEQAAMNALYPLFP